MADDLEISITEWADGYHWTIFDAEPDYAGGQVAGTLVPWAMAQQREPSQIKALRRALVEAVRLFTPAGERRVFVPLAVAGAWGVVDLVDSERRKKLDALAERDAENTRLRAVVAQGVGYLRRAANHLEADSWLPPAAILDWLTRAARAATAETGTEEA